MIGECGDVHQPILVHADVDEGPEVRDVGHHALELHAGLQVLEPLDALAEGGGAKLGPRVAARLFQLGQDVAHGRGAEVVVDETVGAQAAQQRRVADHLANVAPDLAEGARPPDRLRDGRPRRRVGVAVGDAEKPGRLFERLGAEPRHLEELAPIAERAVRVAVADDVRRQDRAETGDAPQQRRRRGVHVHADGVDGISTTASSARASSG